MAEDEKENGVVIVTPESLLALAARVHAKVCPLVNESDDDEFTFSREDVSEVHDLSKMVAAVMLEMTSFGLLIDSLDSGEAQLTELLGSHDGPFH